MSVPKPTGSPVVLVLDSVDSVDRGTGVKTTPLVGSWNGSTSLTNGITRFQSGAAIARHFHNCDESVTVLEGEALCEIEGREYRLSAGDTSFVPSGLTHCFRNASDLELRIHWTYASVHITRTFPDTGKTVRHLSPEDQSQPT
jgi:putative monooxygenase